MALVDRCYAMVIAVQDAFAGSLSAAAGKGLVLDSGAATLPELDTLLDGQRWATDELLF